MTTANLPDSWDDEPWPLDDPAPTTFRPTNRSDTYTEPPQVADLADEAWEYAVDHGVSIERALVEMQHRHAKPVSPPWWDLGATVQLLDGTITSLGEFLSSPLATPAKDAREDDDQ